MLDSILESSPSQLSLVTSAVPDGTQERVPRWNVRLMEDLRCTRPTMVELHEVAAVPGHTVQDVLLGVEVVGRSLQHTP